MEKLPEHILSSLFSRKIGCISTIVKVCGGCDKIYVLIGDKGWTESKKYGKMG